MRPKPRPVFMQNTHIPAERSIAEIQALLGAHGAAAILLDYAGGLVDAVSFQLVIDDRPVAFRLPCRWQAMAAALERSGRRPGHGQTYAGWARRVAWRQILRWVQAQLALTATGMVKMQEVFLPYAMFRGRSTLYETLELQNFAALPALPPPASPATPLPPP